MRDHDVCRRRTPFRARVLFAVAVLLFGLFGASGCGGRATTHHKPGTSHEQAQGSVGRLLAVDDGTGHRLRQVAAEGAPAVTLSVRPDSEDGWNVHLAVRNFRFTPDSAGGGALLGRGHARLFIDGRPVARVYGAWYHLPGALAGSKGGGPTLTAGLYADDHTAWAVGSEPVRASVPLTAGVPSTPPEAPGDPDRVVDIAVSHGEVSPAPGRVEIKKGERVVLRVRSDRADTLHVHGYDEKAVLPAGRTITLAFTADRIGLFEAETHESDLLLTQLVVR